MQHAYFLYYNGVAEELSGSSVTAAAVQYEGGCPKDTEVLHSIEYLGPLALSKLPVGLTPRTAGC